MFKDTKIVVYTFKIKSTCTACLCAYFTFEIVSISDHVSRTNPWSSAVCDYNKPFSRK